MASQWGTWLQLVGWRGLCVLALVEPAPAQITLYVDDDAPAGGNGLSWKTAYDDLQPALGHAQTDPRVSSIWVASGVYAPSGPGGLHSATFQLPSGVAVYGGFSGGETSLGQRDPVANVAVLSGDLNGDDDLGVLLDNCFTVVTSVDAASTTRLDGFTVTGGVGYHGLTKEWGIPKFGGGMKILDGSPTVAHCIFFKNQSWGGGGMAILGFSQPTVLNSSFVSNESVFIQNVVEPHHGAGIGVFDGSGNPNFINCIFRFNAVIEFGASSGGGMYIESAGFPSVTNCTFYCNSVQNDGGGGLHANATTVVDNCIFWGNTASTGHPQVQAAQVAHSCVEHWDLGLPGVYPGIGNIEQAPMFEDELADEDGDLRLLSGSPCIDAGDNLALPSDIVVDFEGNPRVVDGDEDRTPIVDMGAFEHVPGCPTCPGARVWTNPKGGSFHDFQNWDIGIPGPSHPAHFTLPANYVVSFSANVTNKQLLVRNGEVTFDLNGVEYNLLSTSSNGAIVVSSTTVPAPNLTIAGGGELSGLLTRIGDEKGSSGHAVVTDAGSSLFTTDLCVGCLGSGSLNVVEGATATSFIATIGNLAGATGQVTVGGQGSMWSIPFFLAIQDGSLAVIADGAVAAGPGGILVLQEGSITGDGLIIGDVVSIGSILPGSSPGILTIDGDYEQVGPIPGFGDNTGRLFVDVAGPIPGVSHDVLGVTGAAILGGGLIVQSPAGFKPLLSETFDILTCNQTEGAFDVALMPGINDSDPRNQRFMRLCYNSCASGVAGGDAVSIIIDPLPVDVGFGQQREISVGGAPSAATVGDFNDDQALDLAIAIPATSLSDAGQVLVLFNDGTGAFTGGTTIITVGHQPSSIVTADFDGDAGADLAVSNADDGTVSILLSQGMSGAFTTSQTISIGVNPTDLVAGDFSSGRGPDLVVADSGDGSEPGMVRVLVNDGLGTLSLTGTPMAVSLPGMVVYLGSGSIDCDRTIDIAAVAGDAFDAGTAAVLLGTGSGGFLVQAPMSIGTGPADVVVGDLNQDGASEIIVANVVDSPGTISVLVNHGDGTFAPAVNLPVGAQPRSLAQVDLDQDGDRDVAVVADSPTTTEPVVRILRNDLSAIEGGGTQIALAEATELVVQGAPALVLAGDVDGDNAPDVITISDLATDASGAGGVASPSARNSVISVLPNVSACQAGDINCDGYVDGLDLAQLLAAWGPCPGCPADLNGNGTVNGLDLAMLLGAWTG